MDDEERKVYRAAISSYMELFTKINNEYMDFVKKINEKSIQTDERILDLVQENFELKRKLNDSLGS